MIYPLLLIVSDFVALLVAFSLAYIVRVQIDTRPLVSEIEAITFIKAFILLFPIWIIINALLGLYTKTVFEKRLSELARLGVGSFLGILVIIGFDFIVADTIFPARLVPVYGLIAGFSLLVLFRNILWALRRFLFRYGIGVRGVMLIGSNQATLRLVEDLKDTLTSGYDIRAIVGSKSQLPDDFAGRHYSSLEQALNDAPKIGIHMIIQTEIYANPARNKHIFQTVRNHHIAYRFIPSQAEFYTGKNTIEIMAGFPVISVHQTPLIGWGRVVKRLMDIAFGLIGLIIALPFIAIFATIIKLTDPSGPVFYKQKRMTRFGSEFVIYKLRSMYWKYSAKADAGHEGAEKVFRNMGRDDLAEEYAANHKVKNDPRITPVGRLIRKASIDEWPQFFNVLKGDLSLIGPRAMFRSELEPYRKIAGGDVVLSVKSGLTGLWQVSGRSDASIEERVRLELYYVQNWSLWLDIRILLKTVLVVLRGKGAN